VSGSYFITVTTFVCEGGREGGREGVSELVCEE
jgi:hypothetical protein